MLTSLFSLFYVTGEFHRFLHRGRAQLVNIVPLHSSEVISIRYITSVRVQIELFSPLDRVVPGPGWQAKSFSPLKYFKLKGACYVACMSQFFCFVGGPRR